MIYQLKIDTQEEWSKKYKLVQGGNLYECKCGCHVFLKSGEEFVCNYCKTRHTVETEDYVCQVCQESYPDDEVCNDKKCIYPQCVSCKTIIKIEPLTDIDKFGPYCQRCYNQLHKEFKKPEG